MKYLEILKRNQELESILMGKAYQIFFLSNVTPGPFKEIIELTLREMGINANLMIG